MYHFITKFLRSVLCLIIFSSGKSLNRIKWDTHSSFEQTQSPSDALNLPPLPADMVSLLFYLFNFSREKTNEYESIKKNPTF